MRREVTFNIDPTVQDIDLIREVANNPDLLPSQVFEFPEFVICKSGKNANNSDVTGTAQAQAVKGWIGKPIYFQDHKTKADNQIGRIHKAWIEEQDNVTVTKGQGYGIHCDEHDSLFARIENRIHQEMSCGYDLIASHCSNCKAEVDLQTETCSNGHKMGNDAYWLDVEFTPDHVSFVGRSAIEGAGLVAAGAEDEPKTFDRDTEDAKVMRELALSEFTKYMKRAHLDMSDEDITTLSERLTIKDLIRFARIEKDTFIASLPSGKQQTRNTQDEDLGPMTYTSPKDIFQQRKETG